MVARLDILTALALSLVVTACGAAKSEPSTIVQSDGTLKVIGDLRLIANDALNDSVTLADLKESGGLYGIGMPQGLNSELLILDGKAYTGAFEDSYYSALSPGRMDISFLAYGYSSEWEEIALPQGVTSFQDLQMFLETEATARDLDLENGFVFRLEAPTRHLNWFVVGGMGNLEPNPRDSFLRQRQLGGLDDRYISAVGVYSKAYEGIATSPNANMHIHFRTDDDEPLFVGHLNSSVAFRPGGTLFLPKSE